MQPIESFARCTLQRHCHRALACDEGDGFRVGSPGQERKINVASIYSILGQVPCTRQTIKWHKEKFESFSHNNMLLDHSVLITDLLTVPGRYLAVSKPSWRGQRSGKQHCSMH